MRTIRALSHVDELMSPVRQSFVSWHPSRGVVCQKNFGLHAMSQSCTKVKSLEVLQRFFERLSVGVNGEQPPTRTVKQRQRAAEAADSELAKAGWFPANAAIWPVIRTALRSPLSRKQTGRLILAQV